MCQPMRDIGARQVADLESVLARLQFAAEHLDLVGGQIDDALQRQHIGIGGHDADGDSVFLGTQQRARREDAIFAGAYRRTG